MRNVAFSRKSVVRGLAAFAVFALATTTFAATNYVDGAMSDYAGHDGSSWALAFETIQQAVDVAQDGDTVLVAPGVYAKGGQIDSVDNAVSNRVSIGKSLTLKSLKGATVTAIKGEFDGTSEVKTGPGSMRCIGITDDKIDVVIEGFTITGGSTPHGSNVRSSWGAGVCGYSRAVSPIFIVDCIVSNNWGSRAVGVYGCTSVRTLFTDNHALGAGVSIRCGNAANCIFNEPDTPSGGRASVDSMHNLVNCTFVQCKNAINSTQSYNPVYGNCLVAAGDASMTCDKTPAAVLHNFKSERPIVTERVAAESTDWAGSVEPMLVAPIFGDFRPVAGGPADGAGQAANLEKDFLPAKYRTTDFFGRPRLTGGTICLGAIEGVVTPQSGLTYFNTTPKRCTTTIEGHVVPYLFDGYTPYAYAVETPVQWSVNVTTNAGNSLFGIQQRGDWSVMRFPDRKDNFLLSPPPVGTVLTNSVVFGGRVRYVASDGDDTYTGEDLGSEAHPYATIQKAVDDVNLAANGLVFVKAGVYDKGEGFQQYGTNRVAINRGTRVVALDGPEKTFIVGAPDTTDVNTNGCGPAAIRCAAVKSNTQGSLCGFTLTGGYSPVNSDYGGGAFMADNSAEAQLIDCVITNNVGSRGAATYGGWSIGCYIAKNNNIKDGNAISRNGLSSGCVFFSNGSNQNVAGFKQRCYNCTFIAGGKTVNDANAELYNCIIRNAAYVKNPTDASGLIGNVFYNIVTIQPTTGYLLADPLLLDANTGDARLYPTSPAIGAGDASVPNFAKYAVGGVDGEPLLVKDGKPTSGACHKPVVAVQIVVRATGEIEPVGTKYVEQGDSLTVTAKGSEKRRFLGFSVDGELVDTAGEKTYVYSVPAAYCAEPIVLAAAYATNWYVNADAAVGDDANDGWTPETARRTLAAGVKDAAPGDIVHAAAGVYDEGSAQQAFPFVKSGDACPLIQSRVVVPNGVTLEGEDRDTTVIEGGLGDCADGCGTNALRCVYLEQNATVRRFTIRQGRTAPREGPNYEDDNYMGAGVRGITWTETFVEDCFLTNCIAPRGGALLYTRAHNCRIVGNGSQANGAAARFCGLYGCYVGANTGSAPCLANEEIVNCFYAADNANELGDWQGNGPGLLANSVICTCGRGTVGSPKHLTNVVVVGSVPLAGSVTEYGTRRYETAASLLLDDAGRPTAASPLVDTGDNSLVDWATDLDGGQRVYNGAVDVGCYEFDWRETYRRDLGFGGAVTRVSPEVYEDGSRVFLPSGSLDLVWQVANPRGRRNLTAEVTGTGVLAVYRDDETDPLYVWTAATPAAEQTFTFKGPSVDSFGLSFVYTPGADETGGAFLDGLSETYGTILFVR